MVAQNRHEIGTVLLFHCQSGYGILNMPKIHTEAGASGNGIRDAGLTNREVAPCIETGAAFLCDQEGGLLIEQNKTSEHRPKA